MKRMIFIMIKNNNERKKRANSAPSSKRITSACETDWEIQKLSQKHCAMQFNERYILENFS